MASTRSANREAVLKVLEDRQWHGLGELLAVGGSRAPGRVHELRRGEDEGGARRRILNRVRDSQSEYRWVCGCGPVPKKNPDWSIVPHCADCEPVLYEIGIVVPGYEPPVPASVAPLMPPPPPPPAETALSPGHRSQQLALFGMLPAREGSR